MRQTGKISDKLGLSPKNPVFFIEKLGFSEINLVYWIFYLFGAPYTLCPWRIFSKCSAGIYLGFLLFISDDDGSGSLVVVIIDVNPVWWGLLSTKESREVSFFSYVPNRDLPNKICYRYHRVFWWNMYFFYQMWET